MATPGQTSLGRRDIEQCTYAYAYFTGGILLDALRSSTLDLISSAGDLSRGGGGGELVVPLARPLFALLSGAEVRARLGWGRFFGADQLAERARTCAVTGEPPCTPSLLLLPLLRPLLPFPLLLLSTPSTESDETTPRALPCGETVGDDPAPTASEDLVLEIMRPKLIPRDKRFFGWLGDTELLLLAFALVPILLDTSLPPSASARTSEECATESFRPLWMVVSSPSKSC